MARLTWLAKASKYRPISLKMALKLVHGIPKEMIMNARQVADLLSQDSHLYWRKDWQLAEGSHVDSAHSALSQKIRRNRPYMESCRVKCISKRR